MSDIRRLIKNWDYYYFGDAPKHLSGVSLDKSEISLTTVWQTEQLTATTIPASPVENVSLNWSSSDTSVATVDNTWLVTCVTPWECTITVTTTPWSYTASCDISNITEIVVNFDSNDEVTSKWFVFQAIDYGGLTTSWGNLVVNANHNDSWWLIYTDVSSYTKWTFQARTYMQWSAWWGDHHISVAWWDFTWNVRTTNWPQHYFNMTTTSWYTWGSWISDWVNWWNQYSASWWFTWWYVYEIKYDNWTYTMTRYNDTALVTDESTYTDRVVYTWLWAPWNVWIFMRTWYTYQNYILTDWVVFRHN